MQGKGDGGFRGEVVCELDFEEWVEFGNPGEGRGHSRQREQLKQRHRGRNGRSLYKKA